ncbi:tlde1 domain-containing protein [Mesorhizobium sp. KR9-304]|uniref:tlde1 domain-containing protein n=1 Tax=Mesorhizobium sp. KR9-304 TaxID=3156614 RepID=UPI0032B33514
MAFVSKGIGDSDSGSGTVSLSREVFGAVRWVALPCVAVFFASWSVAALASLHSAATERASAGSFVQAGLPTPSQARESPRPGQSAHALLVAPAQKSASLATLSTTRPKPKAAPAVQPPADPFGKVVAEAKLSREKLVAAFERAGMAILDTERSAEFAFAAPIAERFYQPAVSALPAPQPTQAAADVAPASPGLEGVQIAYAAVESDWNNPVQLALASLAVDPYAMGEDEPVTSEDQMPEAVDLPPAKPDAKPAKLDAKPDVRPAREPAKVADEPAAPARKPARTERREPEQALAYARPDKPAVGAFKNLFNTPKAGNGVAIYDISAAVVHMPDGTKLEAHSGIGKMADNPRYVHVKMNGPTPPNTYRLSMREKRFHGVEAVRMTPVGGGKMHGRDGILAHSYLLRGGREESHGCVAFKDYPRFLKAFKQGKVKQIVVVPSMSKMPKVQMVSAGRGA